MLTSRVADRAFWRGVLRARGWDVGRAAAGAMISCALVCGFGEATPVESDPGFVHRFSDGVWFIEWTDHDGQLSGRLQYMVVRGDLTVHADTEALRGMRSGAAVSLNIGPPDLRRPYAGALLGSTLVLTLPRDTSMALFSRSNPGTIERVVFRRATAEDYHRAIAALTARVDNVVRRQPAALAARHRRVVVANTGLQDALDAAASGIDQLRRAADFGPILDGFVEDWARMERDYATLRSDAAAQRLSCAQLRGSVVDGALAVDLHALLGIDDADVFATRRQRIRYQAVQLLRDIRTTRRAFAMLEEAVSQNFLGRPGPAFTHAQVRAAIAEAYRQIRVANDALFAAGWQKNYILAEARALFHDAEDFVAHTPCEPRRASGPPRPLGQKLAPAIGEHRDARGAGGTAGERHRKERTNLAPGRSSETHTGGSGYMR